MTQLLNDLLESVRAQGQEVIAKPKAPKATKGADGPPVPSTWEYLIDALTLLGAGNFGTLKGIIAIMRQRGWTTKAGNDDLAYRTVHSSTYKACRDNRDGYVLGAKVIDRTRSKDQLYALVKGVDNESILKHQAWVASKAPKVEEVTEAPEGTEAPEAPKVEDTTETPDAPEAPKAQTTRRNRRSRKSAA